MPQHITTPHLDLSKGLGSLTKAHEQAMIPNITTEDSLSAFEKQRFLIYAALNVPESTSRGG